MNFSEAESYLYSLGNEVSAMKLGLENIRKLLHALRDPHTKYLKVQVAGTNGKGSVCAFLDSICNEAGISTGTFTSPHLISITERARINGADISENDFARFATVVRETAERMITDSELETIPTFFEQVTAIALLAFADAKVELAILETGLGGRLDATTAANAEIAAITRIDLDHQQYLGETIEEIAAEKAAIIRPGSKVVIGRQRRESTEVIVARCSQLGIVPSMPEKNQIIAIDVINKSAVVAIQTLRHLYNDSNLGLTGRHQIENAESAVLIAELLQDSGIAIDHGQIIQGLETARHPGRLEYEGQFLFDGAHNAGGAQVLREFLDEFETRPINLIFGVMNGKNVAEMVTLLFPKVENIILTKPENERAISSDELAAELRFSGRDLILTANVEDALFEATDIANADEIILVTGSLYLVGEVKQILRSQI